MPRPVVGHLEIYELAEGCGSHVRSFDKFVGYWSKDGGGCGMSKAKKFGLIGTGVGFCLSLCPHLPIMQLPTTSPTISLFFTFAWLRPRFC